MFFSKTSLEDSEKHFSESSREDFKKKHLGRVVFFQNIPWKILKNIFQNLPGKILKKNIYIEEFFFKIFPGRF
jgi:hypothetical protein